MELKLKYRRMIEIFYNESDNYYGMMKRHETLEFFKDKIGVYKIINPMTEKMSCFSE